MGFNCSRCGHSQPRDRLFPSDADWRVVRGLTGLRFRSRTREEAETRFAELTATQIANRDRLSLVCPCGNVARSG